MASFMRELAFGGRLLAKQPASTLLILLVLVPGIAVNLAVFTFVKAVVFQALPFLDADRLTTVFSTAQRQTSELRGLSYPDYRDLAAQNQSLDAFAVAMSSSMNLTGEASAQRVVVELVTPGYFDFLGVGAHLGRTFTDAENQLPRGALVVVVSDELWRGYFGGDRDLVGSPIQLDGREVVVIGVMPEGFRGFEDDVQIWAPLTASSDLLPNRSPEIFEQRGARWLQGFARLRPGVTLREAQEELTTISHRLAQTYPDTNTDTGVLLQALDDYVLGDLRPVLRMLWAIAGLVLLVVVANAVNLLLVRLLDRRKEIAVRAAHGAGPARIARQLLAENLILGLLAGGLGTLLGAGLVRLGASVNPIPLPGYATPRLDLGVLGFALGLSLLLGALLGLLPTLQARRVDLNSVLHNAATAVVGGGWRALLDVRRWLLIGEVAIAVMVLIGASLVYRSFENQRAIDPGFDTDDIVVLRLDLPVDSYPMPAVVAFARRLAEEVGGLPGVRSVGLSTDLPMAGGYSAILVQAESRLAADPEHRIRAYRHQVSPDFFETLGIPLLKGRLFTPTGADSAALEVIVSQKLADLGWPDGDPLGTRLRVGNTWLTVVGIVPDVRFRNLVPDAEGIPEDPDLYLPLFERPPPRLALLAKTDTDATTLVAAVRDLVARLEPDAPIYGVDTMSQLLAQQTRIGRVSSLLFGLLGGLALLFAITGLYAVVSYSVSQRTSEIGLKMAIGASRQRILTGVVAGGLKLVAIGLVLGLVLALGFHRVLASLLFGISATDPATYLLVAALLLGVAALACLAPAVRASSLDPTVALKQEQR